MRAMTEPAPLVFKVATERHELEQVHRLNHQTFADEIPQHAPQSNGALVDRFHNENTYLVGKRGDRVVGMVSVRDRRPFSLDSKIPDLDRHLPSAFNFCEVRLLAVDRDARNGIVFRGLMQAVSEYCVGRGFNAAVISGTVRQLRLYEHLGFVAFGPRTGTDQAQFQPMYVTLDTFRAQAGTAVWKHAAVPGPTVSFLPGPVDVHPSVQTAFSAPLVSHRDARFIAEFRRTKELLCELVKAPHVEILMGSGTLANDAIALQLAALGGPGVVFANGEFGERLMDHAQRAGLAFTGECAPWGAQFSADDFERALQRHPDARWWWMVHHETSTGVLNDLRHATAMCRSRNIKLCSDCVSSIGALPVDLSHVHLASGVSGKALGAVAGLSFVFHHGDVQRAQRAPRYLDLSLYADADGVPFTTASPLVGALRVAVGRSLERDPRELADMTSWLRSELLAIGLRLLVPDAIGAPGIVTIALDPPERSLALGDALAHDGFAVSYRSAYLSERNWLQIALMGECSRPKVELLLRAVREQRAAAA